MTTLSAKAIITAVDHASPIFARVGAAASAAAKRYGNFSASASKLASPGLASIAAPSALSLSSFGHNEYEWDKAVHQYRAIVEMGKEEFGGSIGRKINETSNALGIQRVELLAAAKSWMELGNSPESFIKNVDIAARNSRVVGMTIAEQMTETSALMRAFGYNKDDAGAFKHVEEVFTVASKGFKNGGHAFGEAMKMFAPVAAASHLDIEKAAAMVQTLGGMFQPTEIGNALKTGFLRLAMPVPGSRAMMRAAGVDASKFLDIDSSKLGNADSLIGALRGSGSFTVTDDVEKIIRTELSNVDISQGVDPFEDRLNKRLVTAFGGKKMSAQDRKILQKTVLMHMSSAITGVNDDKMFEALAPFATNKGFIGQVFGKDHAAKWMDLLKLYNQYKFNRDKNYKDAPGAVERKSSIYFEGFAFEFDRLTASWNNMLGSFGASGIKADITSFFQTMSGFFRDMQTANPDSIRLLFAGLVGLAALPVAGLWLAGAATAISTIAAAASSPALMALLAAGGVAALMGGGDLFKAPHAENERNWGEGGAPMMQTFEELKKLFSEVTGLATDIGSGVTRVFDEARALFGLSPSGSPLISGLTSINTLVQSLREGIADLRGKGLFGFLAGDRASNGMYAPGLVEETHNKMNGRTGMLSRYNFAPEDGLKPLRLLSDIGSTPQRVDVQGEARITSDVQVRIEAPNGWQAFIERQSGGEGRVKLNTGQGMSDTGGGGAP